MPDWKIRMHIVKAFNHCPDHQAKTCLHRNVILAALFFIAMSFVLVPVQKATASQLPTSAIKTLIVQEAHKSKYVTPSLALAVAHVESSFRADAISPAGAIGVMQIMPRTGRTLYGLSARRGAPRVASEPSPAAVVRRRAGSRPRSTTARCM